MHNSTTTVMMLTALVSWQQHHGASEFQNVLNCPIVRDLLISSESVHQCKIMHRFAGIGRGSQDAILCMYVLML